jgi:hypothetical protein
MQTPTPLAFVQMQTPTPFHRAARPEQDASKKGMRGITIA